MPVKRTAMIPFRTKEQRQLEEKAAIQKAALEAELARSGREPATHVYGRASTKKQVDSPETQKAMAAKYCEFHGLTNIRYYIDPATTAKIVWDQRQAGAELMRQLRPGDAVVITKLDRAFRKLRDCVLMLEKFERMGIRFHICNMMGGSLDLSSPIGKLMLHMLAAFAEFERELISERTRDGMANVKRQGFKHARFPGYGFQWERRWVHGKWIKLKVSHPEERKIMKAILRWRLSDDPLSWQEIADHLAKEQLVTKEGHPWTEQRCRRACKAEMLLRIKESSVGSQAD
jgi:site-specific DNA recombinase